MFCTGFWVQGILAGSRADLNRCEGCPGVSQTGRVQLGPQICTMGLLWTLAMAPILPRSWVRSVILTHPCTCAVSRSWECYLNL